jgi:hypothetical protein
MLVLSRLVRPPWCAQVCRQGSTLSLSRAPYQLKWSVLFQSLLHHPSGHGLHLHMARQVLCAGGGGVHSEH